MEYIKLGELICLSCHEPITKAVNTCFFKYDLTVQWPGLEGNGTAVPSSVTFCQIIQAVAGAVKPGRGDGPIESQPRSGQCCNSNCLRSLVSFLTSERRVTY